jgi:hypothetical protein
MSKEKEKEKEKKKGKDDDTVLPRSTRSTNC